MTHRNALAAALLTLAACNAGANPEPTLDELPEDIYSVTKRVEAHYDSVSTERETLSEIVRDAAPAIRAYRAGRDARGNRFAANGIVQDLLNQCLDRTTKMVEETLPETLDLIQALDEGKVGIDRFNLLFAQFDADWQAENDCWRGVFADSAFDAWLPRYNAQADTVAREAAQARRRRILERCRNSIHFAEEDDFADGFLKQGERVLGYVMFDPTRSTYYLASLYSGADWITAPAGTAGHGFEFESRESVANQVRTWWDAAGQPAC